MDAKSLENEESSLKEQLKTMKKLLRKKEKRLSKYNRVLKSKHHVRERIHKHNLNKNINSSYDENERDETSKGNGSCNSKNKNKRVVTFEDTLNMNKDSIMSCNLNLELTENQPSPLLHMDSAREDSILKSKWLNYNGSCESNDSFSSAQSISACPKKLDLKKKNNLNSNSSRLKQEFSTPVFKRSKTFSGIKKHHIKRLFGHTNTTSSSNEVANIDCEISDSKSYQVNNQSTPYCNLDNSRIEKTDSIIDTNLLFDTEILKQPVMKEDSNNKLEKSHIQNKNSNYESIPNNKGFRNIEILRKSLLIGINTKYSLVSTAISYSETDTPVAMILCKDAFSIWKLIRDKKDPRNNAELLWDKVYQHDTGIFDECISSQLFMFGGRSNIHNYFMIIKCPSKDQKKLSSTCIYFTSGEDLRIVRKELPFPACSECRISACSLNYWSFSLCINGCKNSNCMATDVLTVGDFHIISFDLKYSQKKDAWELEWELLQKIQTSNVPVLSLNLLFHDENNFEMSLDNELVLWQDISGNLGISNFNSMLWVTKSKFGLEKELANGILIYAAAVKDILFLVLKTKEKLKFISVNPLTCQFDSFYETKLSELNMNENVHCSTVFFENKFIILTSEADVVYLIL